jgi:hypothetical protein
MVTREEVERALVNLWNDSDSEYFLQNLEEDNHYERGDIFYKDEAEQVLEDLDIPDAEDRIVWMNQLQYDSDDLVNLANVLFSVSHCEKCGEKVREGQPDNWAYFQGVLQDEGLLTVTLEPLGDSATLCGECIGTIRSML